MKQNNFIPIINMETIEPFYVRFRTAYEKCGKDKITIHRETGVSRVAINKIIAGDWEPRVRELVLLSKSMNTNPRYLLYGELPMFDDDKINVIKQAEFNDQALKLLIAIDEKMTKLGQ